MKRLKKLIRSLLEYFLDDDKEVSNIVDVLVPTQNGPVATRYLVTGVSGFRLQGMCVSGQGQGVRLIDRKETIDKEQFDVLFDKYVGEIGTEYVWEDTRQKASPDQVG